MLEADNNIYISLKYSKVPFGLSAASGFIVWSRILSDEYSKSLELVNAADTHRSMTCIISYGSIKCLVCI